MAKTLETPINIMHSNRTSPSTVSSIINMIQLSPFWKFQQNLRNYRCEPERWAVCVCGDERTLPAPSWQGRLKWYCNCRKEEHRQFNSSLPQWHHRVNATCRNTHTCTRAERCEQPQVQISTIKCVLCTVTQTSVYRSHKSTACDWSVSLGICSFMDYFYFILT